MSNYFRSIYILFIFLSAATYAQNANVEYDEINGQLTRSDKFKKDFGRYKGFELPLNKGEMANFAILSREFDAKLILVDPNGKIYKQSNSSSKGIASLLTEIPVSGDWILYVVGGIKDNGNFILRYAFAAEDQRTSNITSMDFCSTLNYLIPHANAYFLMLQAQMGNQEIIKFPSSSNAFIDNQSGSFVNIFFSSHDKRFAEEGLINVRDQLKNCLPDWKERDSDWKKIDKLNQKAVIFSEPNSKKPVQLILSLLHQQKENENDSIYELSLEISKTP